MLILPRKRKVGESTRGVFNLLRQMVNKCVRCFSVDDIMEHLGTVGFSKVLIIHELETYNPIVKTIYLYDSTHDVLTSFQENNLLLKT